MGKVIIVGSINMDIVARVPSIPRPGETIMANDMAFFPGGKGANQAVAARRLGAETLLISAVGLDNFGEQMKQFLAAEKIDLTGLAEIKDAPTGTCMITVSSDGENSIVYVPGANMRVSTTQFDKVDVQAGDILVGQFEVPPTVIEPVLRRAKQRGAVTILNPAPVQNMTPEFMSLVDILIINELELEKLRNISWTEPPALQLVLDEMKQLQSSPHQIIVTTLGARGLAALIGQAEYTLPARTVAVVDTTGAGDCFIGACASQLAQGIPIEEALKFATAASSICVQRKGAGVSMPTKEEVIKAFRTS